MGILSEPLRRRFCVCILITHLVAGLAFDIAEAAFASKFSLTTGELYTDNIFFTKEKESDFVTTIIPTLTLLYAPPGENVPTLNLNISPAAAIFARHSELNNFGENWGLNGGYTYTYSPRLSFHVSDVLARQGEYRLGPLVQGGFQVPNLPTSPPPIGGVIPGQGNQNISNFNSGGATLYNNFSVGASYLYRSDVNFTANYQNNIVNYIDQGGSDLYQQIGFRGVYHWRNEHNLHAGYWLGVYKSRNSGTSVTHNFDFGDDYFSNLQYQLTPTLSASLSTGLTFNIGNSGPAVANNTTATITKVWPTAQLSASIHHGLTPTFGVSGFSETTEFYSNFNMQLSEKLSVLANINFPLYNTDDGSFKTFQGTLGGQYRFNPWLTSSLFYNYRMSNSSTNVANNSGGIIEAGRISANSVYLSFTVSWDLWPNRGLSKDLGSQTLTPLFRTPFPTAVPVTPTTTPTQTTPTTPSPAIPTP